MQPGSQPQNFQMQPGSKPAINPIQPNMQPRCSLRCRLVCNLRCSQFNLLCKLDTNWANNSPCSQATSLCSQATNLCTRACSQVCNRTHTSPVKWGLMQHHQLSCLTKISQNYGDPSRYENTGKWKLSATTATTAVLLQSH